ncbi:MAG: hypothetical protein LUC33_00550 [Prevotellaceae bacterium]|nr:hypothetical protein [Prevotellaceae bacterium]
MITLTLTVSKDAVLQEIQRTTGYIGQKMDGDENSYDRISTTDQDALMLQRFWDETKAAFCKEAKRLITAETDDGTAFTLTLEVSNAYSTALTGSVEDALFSYFVNNITAKWCVFTNKQEAEQYSTMAQGFLEDAMRKLLFKRKPVRPVYDD